MRRLVRAILLVLICTGIAAVVWVTRRKKNHVQAVTTWRSLEQPGINTGSEEQAVYAAILEQLHAEKRLKVFVVRDHTITCGRLNDWCDSSKLRSQFPHLNHETLDDYLTQNQTTAPIGNFSSSNLPVELVSDHQLRGYFVETKKPINLEILPSRKISWGLFYQRYGLSPGMVSFSQVGFNSAMDQALVYEELLANNDGIWIRYLLLTKDGETPSGSHWVVKDKIEKYLPEEQPASIRAGEFGTIKGLVLDAKEEGLDKVEMSSIVCGWDIGNLNTVLHRDSVVLADLVNKKTIANSFGLITWYKFRIADVLSEKPLPKYVRDWGVPDPPQEIQPVNSDEFVVAEINGQVEIDGVRVIQYSNSAVYKESNRYLLFLFLIPEKRVAIRTGTDPRGVFLVDKDGTFTAYLKEPYPLSEQMAKRFGNSIENLRNALKN